MEKLITTFSSWKTKSFAISMYKGVINLDIAQKEHKYNHNMLYKKVFLWEIMVSLTFLRWDYIALRLRSSSSNYAPLAIWEVNRRFDCDLCDQVAICLHSERIATDLCASESTDGDLGDHGYQLATNQRSISVLGDLSALHGALWRSHRSPQIAA